MMKENKFLEAMFHKKEYEAPMVERIDARVEKGYQTSIIENEDPTALTGYTLVDGQESKFN